MKIRGLHTLWGPVAVVTAAWIIPALGNLFGIERVAHWSLWVPAGLVALGLVWTLAARVGSRERTALVAVVVLVGAAVAAIRTSRTAPVALETRWWPTASERIVSTLDGVSNEFERLEGMSEAIADRVASHLSAGEDVGLSGRFDTFALLDSLANSVSGLPRGTEIGIQVFDGQGRRVAWAGWPQTISHLDATFIAAGKELFYTREQSLYRILTHILPVDQVPGLGHAVVLVDVPLEVNYRVNNRFLKSASIADDISSRKVADVSFDYFPTMAGLPERLGRFQNTQKRAYERRQRLIAAHRRRIAAAAPQPVGPREAPRDSVLVFHAFPASVEPLAEIAGDPSTGLQGRVAIRSPQGNPLVTVTATSHPLRHYAARRKAGFLFVGRLALVIGWLVLFGVVMARVPVRRPWIRAGVFVGSIVAIRYAILSLYSISPTAHLKVLDPTVFATPLLGGVMRSAGDLLITALFVVIGLYGLLRIVRAAHEAAGPTPPAGSPRIWRIGLKGLVVAGVLWGVYELSRRFANTVVVNSNPRLIGETMRVTDLEVIVLHASMFLMLTGILLAGILVVWALFRPARGTGMVRACALAFVVVAVAALVVHRWEPVVISLLLVAFAVAVPRFVQREDLTSIVIASFALVIISSGIAYTFMARDYDALRKAFVMEKSDELLNPSDNWKVVILEDILGGYAGRQDLRRAVRGHSPDVQRLAFDLWADSPLSLLGYSCAINVITAQDSVVSRFSVDMPYRVRIEEGAERIDPPGDNDWVVLDLTRNTPQGLVRFYRGILNLTETRVLPGGQTEKYVVGRVVVDLPFFFESLEWAARTGPRTPEVLRNVQEGGVAPRVEEPEALLLARLEGRTILESSSEDLPLGMTVPADQFQRARGEKWPLLRAGSHTFRFIVRPTDTPGRELLAGFAVPTPPRHLMLWSTVFSLYLLFTFAVLVAIIVLGSIPRLDALLPTLTPGRKLGFQQKLLGSFLLVALVPAVILGLFSVDFMKGRFIQENRQDALHKAFSARKAFVNLLHGELQFYLNQADPTSLLTSGSGPTRALGNGRVVTFLRDAGEVSASASPALPVRGVLESSSPDDLYMLRENGVPYLGVISVPLRASGKGWSGDVYALYARRVDADVLGDVAEQIGADVNVYDGAELVASSREGLLAGGFISSVMNAGAYLDVSLLGSDHALATERAGQYDYQVAYLPVTRWRLEERDTVGTVPPAVAPAGVDSLAAAGAGPPAYAAMSVPLLFRPESYYAEAQKATSIVLGIFALLFAGTIGLGLVLARGIFEPLRALLAGTRRISQGDFSVRLTLRRSDEIGTVVSAFNEMTRQVASSQQALEERRHYLETILENIGTGVITTDADDRVRTVNAAAARILGIADDAVAGRSADELAAAGVAPELFALLRDNAHPAHGFVADEVDVLRGEGRSTIKYMLTPLEVDGRYLGAVLVFEDLTELIRSKKLSAWVEMARQIAHEIKNPLTPIRISTQFMQRAYEQRPEKFDEVFREGTETILHQVDVLKRIASEFSSYGRMQQLHLGRHRLAPLLEKILAPYYHNDAGVTIAYENGAPDAEVVVDPEAMRRICTNLIENALEAMPDGGSLSVSCSDHVADGGRFLMLSFRDTGPGLSDEAADKLFEPYFSTKTTGTGLGLAICRQLSHEMGGEVTVRNAPDGGGVVATLTVPRAQRSS